MYKAVSDRELNHLTKELVSKIENKLDLSEVVTEATANKIIKLDDSGKLPADILNGIIPIENIPSAALERCVIVADDEARFNLTEKDVQIGDTVKVVADNKMYYVKDTESLFDENGYEIYSSGSAEKLTNARNISLSGDVEGSVDFDGSTDVVMSVNVNKLSNPLILSNNVYGESFPSGEIEDGRMFLLKIPNSGVIANPLVLNPNLFGDEFPTENLTDGQVYFLKVPDDEQSSDE